MGRSGHVPCRKGHHGALCAAMGTQSRAPTLPGSRGLGLPSDTLAGQLVERARGGQPR